MVTEDVSIQKHIDAMLNANYIAVDTETTGIEGITDGRAWLVGISVAYHMGDLGVVSAYFPFRHPDTNCDRKWIAALQMVFDRVPLIFHNLKFDLHSLASIGIHPRATLYDTLNIYHMINEELLTKKLDYLARRYLQDKKDKSQLEKWTKLWGWTDVPYSIMNDYACHDAELTLGLFELAWPEMRRQELTHLWKTEVAYTGILFKLEQLGVLVNKGHASYKADVGQERMADLLDELGFNPASPLQLGNFLQGDLGLPIAVNGQGDPYLTDAGKPSYNKKAMEVYDAMLANSTFFSTEQQKSARKVLEYRGWQKAVSSLYLPALELCSPDGRIRPNYKQHGTVTGRLSCEKPNLQQIPRSGSQPWNGDAKETFDVEDGYKLLEFDYSQLEFRLGAVYAEEYELIAAFNAGVDPFITAAKAMYQLDIDKEDPLRQTLKTYTYAKLYGAGYKKTAQTTGLPVEEMRDVDARFNGQYPGFKTALDKCASLARSRGYVKYWTGRRRHFKPGIEDGPYYKAYNSVIQGGGAELVKRSMLRVAEGIESSDIRMVLTVHDSIVMEVRNDLVDQVKPAVIEAMSNWPEFPVKLDVECKEWGKK